VRGAEQEGDRQLKATAENVRVSLKEQGVEKLGAEGEAAGGWVLIDYVHVVVHAFSQEARDFYQLEMLWGDAPKVEWQGDASTVESAGA